MYLKELDGDYLILKIHMLNFYQKKKEYLHLKEKYKVCDGLWLLVGIK